MLLGLPFGCDCVVMSSSGFPRSLGFIVLMLKESKDALLRRQLMLKADLIAVNPGVTEAQVNNACCRFFAGIAFRWYIEYM